MLKTDQFSLHAIRDQVIAKGLDAVDFTEEGQMTKNYDEYLEMMSQISGDHLHCLGIAAIGSKNAVSKLTKDCEIIVCFCWSHRACAWDETIRKAELCCFSLIRTYTRHKELLSRFFLWFHGCRSGYPAAVMRFIS